MDHRQLMLHELLQEDQEPFHLNTYISDKRSQLSSSPPTTHHTNFPISPISFFRKPSPEISPCGGALLRVPSKTAALLLEAAMRIQNQQRHSKPRTQIISFLGSFFKILKYRSKFDGDVKENENSEGIRTSSFSCYGICISKVSQEPRFCYSPSSSREFFSPITSPIRSVNQGLEVEQEQCSPVSVLDSLYDDEDDNDQERSHVYANIERTRQQLMERLRRFEKLASIDSMELELEKEEHQRGGIEFEDKVCICKLRNSDTSSLKKKLVGMVDMMVKSEMQDEWKRFAELVVEEEKETAAEIELAILGRLMEELSDDL